MSKFEKYLEASKDLEDEWDEWDDEDDVEGYAVAADEAASKLSKIIGVSDQVARNYLEKIGDHNEKMWMSIIDLLTKGK